MLVQCTVGRIFYNNKLSLFVSELPEKNISVVVVQCVGSILYNQLSWLVFELHKKDISNVRFSVGSILQLAAATCT